MIDSAKKIWTEDEIETKKIWTKDEIETIKELNKRVKVCYEIDAEIKVLKIKSDIQRAANMELIKKLGIGFFHTNELRIDISTKSIASGVDEKSLAGIIGANRVNNLKELVPATIKKLVKEKKLPKMVLDTILHKDTKEFLKVGKMKKGAFEDSIFKIE